MIKTETLNDGKLIRHWSDLGVFIRQVETGVLYDEAVDTVPCRFTYEESDEEIPEEIRTISGQYPDKV